MRSIWAQRPTAGIMICPGAASLTPWTMAQGALIGSRARRAAVAAREFRCACWALQRRFVAVFVEQTLEKSSKKTILLDHRSHRTPPDAADWLNRCTSAWLAFNRRAGGAGCPRRGQGARGRGDSLPDPPVHSQDLVHQGKLAHGFTPGAIPTTANDDFK
jgi:hypothetical protein